MHAVSTRPLPAPRHAHDPPRTLVIVGTDGAGKSTTIEALVQQLRNDRIQARRLANVAARSWLTKFSRALGMTFPTFTQDFFETSIRSFNVARNMLFAARSPGLSVMDRHLYCQLVLRRLRGHPPGLLLPWLAAKSTEHARIVLLDIDPILAFERINSRGKDDESMEYLRDSRNEYLRLAQVHGWITLDASLPTSQLVEQLRLVIGK
ncbi:dTMP kinase [Arthrobacter sp. JUb119]|uniref:AAA family ATPase n=2 Tax=Micrococcales TaxID=85006 RepID=UPI000CFC55F6|nr:AAA family ATPase [Arthrobacter sp. MYb214]MCS3493471.1 dTMP kinase [Arthrobacter sp. JUb119]PRB74595.1 thymidylate kinase [Arthrobacter sp. MYb214]